MSKQGYQINEEIKEENDEYINETNSALNNRRPIKNVTVSPVKSKPDSVRANTSTSTIGGKKTLKLKPDRTKLIYNVESVS